MSFFKEQKVVQRQDTSSDHKRSSSLIRIVRNCASVLGLRLLAVAGCCRWRASRRAISPHSSERTELWASQSVGGQSSGHRPLAKHSGELRRDRGCVFRSGRGLHTHIFLLFLGNVSKLGSKTHGCFASRWRRPPGATNGARH
jgi:hypothetical protein